MNIVMEKKIFISQMMASIRIALFTAAICCFIYPMMILGVGQTLASYTANGSLVRNQQGRIVGSELISQSFSRPEYFWPRPSAVNYNASASGGSNLSPTNLKLRDRAKVVMARFKTPPGRLIPSDAVTASGSGLDPYITLPAAECQAQRVASARNLSLSAVMGILKEFATRPGGAFTPEPLVNVLLVNMALDRIGKDDE